MCGLDQECKPVQGLSDLLLPAFYLNKFSVATVARSTHPPAPAPLTPALMCVYVCGRDDVTAQLGNTDSVLHNYLHSIIPLF